MAEDGIAAIDPARLGPPAGRRVAIVGGCGGIGRAVTRAALATGLRVAVLDLDRSLGDHPPPAGALAVALDATDERRVEAAFAEVAKAFGGGLDGLVNLAGFANRHARFDELSLAEWEATVAGSLRSTYLCCRAALPLLRASPAEEGAAIVNTASGLAVRLLPGFAPYGAAKAGVIAFTKSIAVEMAPAVRANVLAPGAVDTEFHTGGTGRPADTPNAAPRLDRDAYSRIVPLRRIAVAADMVGPILFLLGPAARFLTGQVLHVNGGGLMP